MTATMSDKIGNALWSVQLAAGQVDCIQVLADLEAFSYKQAVRRLEKAVRLGLIDYGVSLKRAWLTEAGKQALSAWEAAR